MKGRALRRALQTTDSIRVNSDVPLITDTTELITPALAHEMLQRNKSNRPINWSKVEEYADAMKRGEWRLHGQGIILDVAGNILTGQKRLWAVIYSGCNVYMRVSRGNPPETAHLIDRGTPQTSRDLASRETRRKHSPTEVSVARAICALMGNTKPSTDVLAITLSANADLTALLLAETKGTKKTKSVLMVLGAVCVVASTADAVRSLAGRVDRLSETLDQCLAPQTASQCWNRGAAFGLAMDHAQRVVKGNS